MGWFEKPPGSMSPLARCAVIEEYLDEVMRTQNISMRWHIWRMATEIQRVQVRLSQGWASPVPPETAMESLDTFEKWQGLHPVSHTSQNLPSDRSSWTAEDRERYAQSKRNKEARRPRSRAPQYDVIRTQGWEALDLIKAKLDEHKTALDPEFQEYLAGVHAQYTFDTDYTDSSDNVRRMQEEGLLSVVTDKMLQEDEDLYLSGGLEALHRAKVDAFAFSGMPQTELRAWLQEKAPQKVDLVMDLMSHGQRAFMLKGFTPNGFDEIRNGAKYELHRKIFEKNAADLHKANKAILIKKTVLKVGDLAQLHGAILLPVEKDGGKSCPRIVTHMSHSTRSHPSYNDSVDMDRHLKAYRRRKLPMLKDFADLLCEMKEHFPGVKFLHAAVIDAASAFETYPLSFEKCKLVWSLIDILRDGEVMQVYKGGVAGMFGDRGAGDSWDVLGDLLDELHNAASTLFKSKTYVDDLGAFAPPLVSDVDPSVPRWHYKDTRDVTPSTLPGCEMCPGTRYAIMDAVVEARDNLARLAGPNSTKLKKVKIYSGYAELLGWHFDLRYTHFYVTPLRPKLDKMAHYLFNIVPIGSVKTNFQTMQSLTGLLCWFSQAIPLGKSFVYTLFQCQRCGPHVVVIHAAAQRDLTFWRALVRVALEEPVLVGCPLELPTNAPYPD